MALSHRPVRPAWRAPPGAGAWGERRHVARTAPTERRPHGPEVSDGLAAIKAWLAPCREIVVTPTGPSSQPSTTCRCAAPPAAARALPDPMIKGPTPSSSPAAVQRVQVLSSTSATSTGAPSLAAEAARGDALLYWLVVHPIHMYADCFGTPSRWSPLSLISSRPQGHLTCHSRIDYFDEKCSIHGPRRVIDRLGHRERYEAVLSAPTRATRWSRRTACCVAHEQAQNWGYFIMAAGRDGGYHQEPMGGVAGAAADIALFTLPRPTPDAVLLRVVGKRLVPAPAPTGKSHGSCHRARYPDLKAEDLGTGRSVPR